MHFRKEKVEEFLSIFETHKSGISSFTGCVHLQLFTDQADPECYVTISNWESDEALASYRSSALFREVWSKVKRLFSAPAEAYTLLPGE